MLKKIAPNRTQLYLVQFSCTRNFQNTVDQSNCIGASFWYKFLSMSPL